MKSEKLMPVILTVVFLAAYCVAVCSQVSLPEGASKEWWGKVQKNIQEEEYNISGPHQGEGALFSAFNRAQGFEILFTERGAVIRPADKSGWSWGLELQAKTEGPRPKAEVRTSDNRVEINRGNITEWYVNSPDGIEQGFTISRQIGNAERLAVDMKMTGTLRPKFADDGRAIDFYGTGNMAVLTYSGLKAYDSEGTVLPSRFEAVSGGIRIAVDDRNAAYPVTIDPLAASPSCTLQGDQADSMFGWSVSTAGDVNGDGYSDVIVSAPVWTQGVGGNGMVYLYLGSASGPGTTPVWSMLGGGYSFLGLTVAPAGDINGDGFSDWIINSTGATPETIFIEYGDPGCDFSEEYFYEDNNEGFGTALAPAGDVNGDGYSDIIVSEPYYGNAQGKVFLYLGSRSGIIMTAAWSVLGENDNDNFGLGCSFAGGC